MDDLPPALAEPALAEPALAASVIV
jgi:hypothetical protein